jgi:methionine-gamma-lyase
MKAKTPPDPHLHPESQMMSYAYDPDLASHSVKPPLYLTSTFSFTSAEHGKAYAEVINDLRKQRPDEDFSNTYIYSRDTNPNLEIFERRLAVWENAEAGAAFESGMAAIAFTFLGFLNPGDVLVHSEPTYGGTDYLIKRILVRFGIKPVGVRLRDGNAGLDKVLNDPSIGPKVGMIYLETPCNPSNLMADIAHAVAHAKRLEKDGKRPLVVIDNTFLGPVFQQPLMHGADLSLYSATKYIGGHSDVIAGAALGKAEYIGQLKLMRAMLGGIPAPHTCWLLTRSLETLKLRMQAQCEGAQKVAAFLAAHPKVDYVNYLGMLDPQSEQGRIYAKQCHAPGAMISVYLKGGEAESFRFLNHLKLLHMAVSLGGNESLAEHPASMTHIEVDLEDRIEGDITDALVRLSIGIEHPDDLIADIAQALEYV